MDYGQPDSQQNQERRHGPAKHHTVLYIIIAISVILIAIGFRSCSFDSEPEAKIISVLEDKKVPVQKTVVETIEEEISFEKYFEDSLEYDRKFVKLVGMGFVALVGNKERAGAFEYYLIDDFGNKILLNDLSPEEKKAFPKIGQSTQIYEIQGTFLHIWEGPEIDVKRFGPGERPVSLNRYNVTVEETVKVWVNKTVYE